MSRRHNHFSDDAEEEGEDEDSERDEFRLSRRPRRYFACITGSSGSGGGGYIRKLRAAPRQEIGRRHNNDFLGGHVSRKLRGRRYVRFNDTWTTEDERGSGVGRGQMEKRFGGKNFLAHRTVSDSSSTGSMGFEPENVLEAEFSGNVVDGEGSTIESIHVEVEQKVIKKKLVEVQTQTLPLVLPRMKSRKTIPTELISSSPLDIPPQKKSSKNLANILNNNNDYNNNDIFGGQKSSRHRSNKPARSAAGLVQRRNCKIDGIQSTKARSCLPASKSVHQVQVKRQEVTVYQVHHDHHHDHDHPHHHAHHGHHHGHHHDDNGDEESEGDDESVESEEEDVVSGEGSKTRTSNKSSSFQSSNGEIKSSGDGSHSHSKHHQHRASKKEIGHHSDEEGHHENEEEKSIQDEDLMYNSERTSLRDSFFEQEILASERNSQRRRSSKQESAHEQNPHPHRRHHSPPHHSTTRHSPPHHSPSHHSPLHHSPPPLNNAGISPMFQSIPPPPPGFCQEIRVNMNQNPPQLLTQLIPCLGAPIPLPPCPLQEDQCPPPVAKACVKPDPCVPLQITCTPTATYTTQSHQRSSNKCCNNNPCCCQTRSGMFCRLTHDQRIRCQRCRVLNYCKSILTGGGGGRSIEYCGGGTSGKDVNNNSGLKNVFVIPPYQMPFADLDKCKWKSEYTREFKDWSKERPFRDGCSGPIDGRKDVDVSIQGSSLRLGDNENCNVMSPVRYGANRQHGRSTHGNNMSNAWPISWQGGGGGSPPVSVWPSGNNNGGYGGQYNGGWNNGGSPGGYPSGCSGGGQIGGYHPAGANGGLTNANTIPFGSHGGQMNGGGYPGSSGSNGNAQNEYVFLIGPSRTLVSGGVSGQINNGYGFPPATPGPGFPVQNGFSGYPSGPNINEGYDAGGGAYPHPEVDGYGKYSYAVTHHHKRDAHKRSTAPLPTFSHQSVGPHEYDEGVDWDKDPYPFFTKGSQQTLFPDRHGHSLSVHRNDHHDHDKKPSNMSHHHTHEGHVRYHDAHHHPDGHQHSQTCPLSDYPHRIRNTEEADKGNGPGQWGHWGKDWGKKHGKVSHDHIHKKKHGIDADETVPPFNGSDTSLEEFSDEKSSVLSHRLQPNSKKSITNIGNRKSKNTIDTGTNPHDQEINDGDGHSKNGKRASRKSLGKKNDHLNNKSKSALKLPKEQNYSETSPSPPPSPIADSSKSKHPVKQVAPQKSKADLPETQSNAKVPPLTKKAAPETTSKVTIPQQKSKSPLPKNSELNNETTSKVTIPQQKSKSPLPKNELDKTPSRVQGGLQPLKAVPIPSKKQATPSKKGEKRDTSKSSNGYGSDVSSGSGYLLVKTTKIVRRKVTTDDDTTDSQTNPIAGKKPAPSAKLVASTKTTNASSAHLSTKPSVKKLTTVKEDDDGGVTTEFSEPPTPPKSAASNKTLTTSNKTLATSNKTLATSNKTLATSNKTLAVSNQTLDAPHARKK